MITLSFNTLQNIRIIESLHNSRIKTARNKQILKLRVARAESEVKALRIWANCKADSNIAKHLNARADFIQAQLDDIFQDWQK